MRIRLRALLLSLVFVLLSVPVVMAQDFCEGNFDYDQDVDGSDVLRFREHFGRSTFGSPCQLDGPAPVPKTGQTISYVEGDDGDSASGVTCHNPRFTDNENGTITDNLTGLVWLKNANCFGERTWFEALSDCKELTAGSCGLIESSYDGTWRLPNRNELSSLVDLEQYNPAIPFGHPFDNVGSYYYWSSTTCYFLADHAWNLGINAGITDYKSKNDNQYSYVWCVRGGH